MKLVLLALALLMAFIAVAMAQAASPAVAVSGEMPGPVPTKADIEQLVGHPISDEDWNKKVSLDPSPAVLLGSNNPNGNNADSSPASTLHPFVFVFLLFVFVPIFDF